VKQESLKHLADGLTTLAVSTGAASGTLKYFEFMDAHSGSLGFLSATFFGSIGALFYYLNYRKGCQADENKRQMELNKKEHDQQLELVKAQVANNLSEFKSCLKAIEAAVINSKQG
jgi:hypothetical protein